MAKALKLALVSTGLAALVIWTMPDWIVIGFLFLILPGIVMSLMPTIFLYLCVFSAVWFTTRKQGEKVAALYGLAGVGVLALGLPLVLNRWSEELLAEARASEKAPKQPVKGAGMVKLDLPRSVGDSGCDELCQLLLLNDEAKQVVVRTERLKGPKVFQIKREDCRVDLAGLGKALEGSHRHWSNAERSKEIAQAAKWRIAGGECLVGADLSEYRDELNIRWVDENSEYSRSALQLEARPPWNRGVEVSVGGQVVGRETVSQQSWLSLPLHFEPIPNGMGFRGWRWGRKMERVEDSKIDRLAMLRRLTALDLDTPRGLGSSSVRELLDAALADTRGSNAAFVLLPDYYKNLREEGFDSRDRQRLAKLILDDRVTDFSYFNWSEKQRENVGPTIRDAMLQRLIRLGVESESEADRAVFLNLQHVAARLGRNTYAGQVPLLDDLLLRVGIRPYAPDLIQRLAEQGKEGAEKLVRIAEAEPSRTAKEMDGARLGLCAVAVDARDFLPRLRAVQGSFTRGHAWRGMLVALGAEASEFSDPNFRDQAKYEAAMRKEAQRCLSGKSRS